jgi:hypothetical protein
VATTFTFAAETLNRLGSRLMAALAILVADSSDDEGERGALCLAVLTDVVGRLLETPDPSIATDMNAVFAARRLPWRLVSVS